MTKARNKSVWETAKFVARTALLVGVPAVIAELAVQKPEWGVWLGIASVVLDKLIHESPTKAKGLVWF